MEIYNYLKILHNNLLRYNFMKTDFKWILGENIIKNLLNDIDKCNEFDTEVKEGKTLFGIPVEIDRFNKDIIKLYMEISDILLDDYKGE